MDSYRFLSAYYDRFTDDVGYDRWADYFEQVFARCGFRPALVLDLACGTGTLTGEMARRGYEMIGADASDEMLMQAMNNTLDCDRARFFCISAWKNSTCMARYRPFCAAWTA